MAGISRLQTEAATIAPAAKPVQQLRQRQNGKRAERQLRRRKSSRQRHGGADISAQRGPKRLIEAERTQRLKRRAAPRHPPAEHGHAQRAEQTQRERQRKRPAEARAAGEPRADIADQVQRQQQKQRPLLQQPGGKAHHGQHDPAPAATLCRAPEHIAQQRVRHGKGAVLQQAEEQRAGQGRQHPAH